MQKCKICGTRIDEGTTVCPSCGAKVVSSGAMPAAGTNADTAAETAKARVSSTTQVIKTTCANCGAEVIGEHRFCPQCGVNLKEAAEQNTSAPAQQERRCPSCGSIVQANSVFCPDCGASLSGRKPATAPTPQASATAATPAPAPATATNRKVKLTLKPTSACESPEVFDNVHDLVNSKLMQDRGGEWMLEVDGELTEKEMNFICDRVIVPGRAIKSLDLSWCSTAYLLKDTQGSEEYLLTRCKALETIKLPDRTIEGNRKVSSSYYSSRNVKSNDRSRSLIIFICALFFLVFIIGGIIMGGI
ncbi:MAG: zinc ribbon domain-containing protein [Treponema sp.]|nr:zinc ribbon domain-containing protein [Treponema sp.]